MIKSSHYILPSHHLYRLISMVLSTKLLLFTLYYSTFASAWLFLLTWLSQLAQHKLYHCKLKQWKLLEKLHELCIATFLQSPSKWSRKLAAVHEIIFRLISSVKNLQQVLYYYYLVHSFFWFQKVTTNYIKPWPKKKKDRRFVGMMTKWQMIISSPYQLADAKRKKTKYLPHIVSASQQMFSTKGHY